MIVVAGEALIDLAPRDGLLAPLPGGSPYNVAVGLGRLETAPAYLGGLSTDAFGQRLAARLEDDGVDVSRAPRYDEPTTLAVVHLDDAGRASYGFYLHGTAAAVLDRADVAALPDGAALHVSLGAIGLGHHPTGHTLTRLLEQAAGGRFTSLDPNVRPNVFGEVGGRDDYAARLERLLPSLDLVKVSDEDIALLRPEASDPLEVARGWAGLGPALVVVTRGADGAVAVRPDGDDIEVPGERIEVVDTVGAGDAFTSGLLAWCERSALLDADALRAADAAVVTDALRAAVHLAAVTCTRAGGDPPRLDELTAAPWA